MADAMQYLWDKKFEMLDSAHKAVLAIQNARVTQ